jgi:hypothetical protein
VTYAYTSTVDSISHPNSGLVGIMTIGSKGSLKADGVTPSDVDYLVPLLFNVSVRVCHWVLEPNSWWTSIHCPAGPNPAGPLLK